jgi:hypothetical protein
MNYQLVFKTYGYRAASQCMSLIADLKMGQYMKIPPRVMFFVQIYGTVVGSLGKHVFTVLLLIRPVLHFCSFPS